MYVHCIIKDKDVVGAMGTIAGIDKVTHDSTFDTAVPWSAKEMTAPPDLIFCEEYAVNSQLDMKTGKFNRDKIVLEALKQIRFNLPDSRVVILLQTKRKFSKEFLQYLISLGIYDLYFVDSFGLDDLKKMIFNPPRNLRDVAEYVTEVEISPGSDFPNENQNEKAFDIDLSQEKEREAPSKSPKKAIVPNVFGIFKKGFRKTKEELQRLREQREKEQKNKATQEVIKNETVEAAALLEPKKSEKIKIVEISKAKRVEVPKPLPVNRLRTKVFVVVGAAHRVGSTSFALALAKAVSEKYPVEILDVGGGASKWLVNESNIPVRDSPKATSISPGIVTIIDSGTNIPEEVIPLTDKVFIVTDLSKTAMYLKPFKNLRGFLVGNRGASKGGLKELAQLWNFDYFCALPEDDRVKQAEVEGVIPFPMPWRRQFKSCLKKI